MVTMNIVIHPQKNIDVYLWKMISNDPNSIELERISCELLFFFLLSVALLKRTKKLSQKVDSQLLSCFYLLEWVSFSFCFPFIFEMIFLYRTLFDGVISIFCPTTDFSPNCNRLQLLSAGRRFGEAAESKKKKRTTTKKMKMKKKRKKK